MIKLEVAKIKGFADFSTRFLKKNCNSVKFYSAFGFRIPTSDRSHPKCDKLFGRSERGLGTPSRKLPIETEILLR